MARRIVLALTAMVLLIALTGCTERTVVITWKPNPIVLAPGENVKGTVTLKTTGLLQSLRIDEVSVEVFDANGDWLDGKSIKLNITVPLFVNPAISREVEMDIGYDFFKTHGISEVVVSVTGTDPGSIKIPIVLLDNDT